MGLDGVVSAGGTDDLGGLIVVRKLVALDITLHGNRFILAEFGIGTPAIRAVGLWLMSSSVSYLLGLYLLLTGVNYIPLLTYAFVIVGSGTARKEVEYGLTHDRHYNRRYSTQQLLIFVPFAVLVLAVVQELKWRQNP
jgi:hypothetical protein